MKRLNADPWFRERRIASIKRRNQDPVLKARHNLAIAQSLQRFYAANPIFKAKKSASSSERMKLLNGNPEFRAKLDAATSERMKLLNGNPEFRAKLDAATSERMKLLNGNPEFRAKSSERMKLLNGNPEFRAKQRAASAKKQQERRQISSLRAEEAIFRVLKQAKQIKEPIQGSLIDRDLDLEIVGFSRQTYEIDHSLPILEDPNVLQDPNDPSCRLLGEVDGPIDLSIRARFRGFIL
jgi:hypothetical protein